MSELPSENLALFTFSILIGLSLAGLLFIWRRSRIRKWEAILSASTRAVVRLKNSRKRVPRWMHGLPRDLSWKSNIPLRETLYRECREKRKSDPSESLRIALKRTLGEKPQTEADGRGTADSQDEKIKSLVGASSEVPSALPTEKLVENMAVNIAAVIRGKKSFSDGVEHAMWDSLGAGGGYAGAKIGSAAALSLAPWILGAATLTPVGVVFGAWAGSMLGRKMGNHFKSRRTHAAMKKLKGVCEEFKSAFVETFPALLSELERDYLTLRGEFRTHLRSEQPKLGRIFSPNLKTVFYTESLARLEFERKAEIKLYRALRTRARKCDSEKLATLLDHVTPEALRRYPALYAYYDSYHEALDELRGLTTPTSKSA